MSIKAAASFPRQTQRLDRSMGCFMSKFDMLYLGLVLVAFGGFAAALAYYSLRR
jgi:hypothetical protein